MILTILHTVRFLLLIFPQARISDFFCLETTARVDLYVEKCICGSMFILLSLNITMNRVGGASVIAKFQS